MDEPTTVGLTERAHDNLRRLKDNGYFDELVDAYRFAVAFALASGYDIHNEALPSEQPKRTTIFNVGTLDPAQKLQAVVRSLGSVESEPIYKTIERLAEYGVKELTQRMENGQLNILAMLEEAERKATEEFSQ